MVGAYAIRGCAALQQFTTDSQFVVAIFWGSEYKLLQIC
jgi:hypothetical protein